MEAPPSAVDEHHRATHRTTRIDLWYPGRMYVSGRVNIFDMVDINLFTAVALNMMVLKLGYTGESEPMFYNYLRPLTSLNEGLYALSCEEDVCCLATLVRSFKLIRVYIEHGVTVLDSYLRAPRFRETLEDITDEPAVIWSRMTRTELYNERVNLNISQVETQSELPVSEEPDVGPTQELILAEVSTQEPIMAEVSTQEPIVAEVSTEAPIVEEEDESARTDREFFYDDEGIDTLHETEYDVQSSEDAGTGTSIDDDDDVDEDFLVDEENEIVKPDVDVHLFGITIDLPFDNIGITNLVPDDVLKGEDVDVINADGFDSNLSNDEERNYRKRRLAELRTKMEGVINASGQWKYLFYTSQKFNTPKEAKDRVYLHSIESRRNLKLYKNDSVRIRARCEGKVPVFTMSQVRVNLDIPIKAVQDQLQRELEVQISMSKAFRAKAKAEREIRGDHVLQYSIFRDYVVELQSTNPNTTIRIAVKKNIDPSLPTRVFQRIYFCLGALKLGFRACRRDMLGLDGAFMNGPFPGQVLVADGLDLNNEIYPLAYALVEAERKSSWYWFLQCLGDDIDLHPNSNFTFISDRKKGIIPAIKTVYPEHRYCLRHIHENMKHGWDFEKCMLELKTMNPKAHERLNKIPAEHWARSHFSGRAKSDLLLNNISEVFNGKIVGGRDKPVITLLEYIKEYCMKRIMNVQGVIDKCTSPLTPTATRIMESIKKEAHLMKVQWNGANKYQVSGSLSDQCVVDVVSGTTPRNLGKSLLLVEYMEGNILSQDTTNLWDQLLGEVHMSNNTFSTQASCPGKEEPLHVNHAKTRDTIRQHVKDKVERQQQVVISALNCGNNAEADGSASRQAQQTELAVGQDGLGGSGAGEKSTNTKN
ncbi:heat stress transcription factor B-4-like protein [Tanacetum coccineum]